jgi:hypothetical protein
MSGNTNHRTWQLYQVGHFITTVHLDPIADGRKIEHQKDLANLTGQLIELMDRHRLPATWAVSDPTHSAATSHILRSSVPHELAILGDATWLGPMAGRTRFARELSRRVAQARSAGLAVHTLVPRVASIEPDVDLVVKQQITAIAGINTLPTATPATSSPRALHFGVWEIPVAGMLPARSGWFSTGGWSIWRRIRAAAKDARIFHLLIDAPLVCEEGRATQKTITWLMERVATLRDRGLVRVETLRATAARLSDVPAVKPQRSILRRAA